MCHIAFKLHLVVVDNILHLHSPLPVKVAQKLAGNSIGGNSQCHRYLVISLGTFLSTLRSCGLPPSPPSSCFTQKCNFLQLCGCCCYQNKKFFLVKMPPPAHTWNLSKNLHRRIFRLKILHRQFHLISTVLVGKNTKNE